MMHSKYTGYETVEEEVPDGVSDKCSKIAFSNFDRTYVELSKEVYSYVCILYINHYMLDVMVL